MSHKPPRLLTIAGSDPSGGAGLQGDLKTFAAFGCYGMAVVTAITVQNTRGVVDFTPLAPELVRQQISALLLDLPPDGVKIGMVATAENAQAITEALSDYTSEIVLDPVLSPSHGATLAAEGLENALTRTLMTRATLITPNLYEASVLSKTSLAKTPEDMMQQGAKLLEAGARAVLVKGGDLDGAPIDILIEPGRVTRFAGDRIKTRHTHGTGCALSSAITTQLAQGASLAQAIASAKEWLQLALSAAQSLELCEGHGPPHHFHELWR